MRKFHKIMALIITAVMLVTICPVQSAFAADIVGVDKIARAPIGKTAAHPYTLPGENNVVWSVEGAPEGVVMTPEGALLVPGETVLTENTDILITAKDKDGNILAEKSVLFEYKLNSGKTNNDYVDFPKRGYANFEIFNVGDTPISRYILNENWDDTAMRFDVTPRPKLDPCIVKEEEDGNKYVSASGECNWSNNGCTFRVWAKFPKTTHNGYFARYMIEEGASSASLMFCPGQFDIRYAAISDTETGIYLHALSGTSYSTKELLTTVTPGQWFDVWIDYDFVNSKINVYIDGKKVIEGAKLTEGIGSSMYTGAATDDAAYFSGFYVPASFPAISDKVYLTDSMDTAVMNFDNSMNYGSYSADDKVSHEITEANGAEVIDGKIFIPAGSGDVEITSKEVKIPLETALEEEIAQSSQNEYILPIHTPYTYDFTTTRTITRNSGVEEASIDASEGEETVTLPDAKGNLMFSFDYTGELSVSLSDGESTKSFSGEEKTEMTEVQIFVDTFSGTYNVFTAGELTESGNTSLEMLSEVSFDGMNVENFIFSSVNPTKPYVLNPEIKGISAAGQTLEASFGYYSPWFAPKKSESIEWFSCNTEDGEYDSVGTGDSFVVPEDLAETYLRYSVTVSDGKSDSIKIYSKPVFINSVFDIALADNKLTVTVRNVLDSSDVLAGAMLCSGGKVTKTVFKNIALSGDSVDWVIPAEGYDGAIVSLLYPESLLPVGASKSVGKAAVSTAAGEVSATATVKDGVLSFTTKPETLTTIIVYGNKVSDADFTQCYSKVFSKEEILSAAETSEIVNDVRYVNTLKTSSDGSLNIVLPSLPRGSYRAEIIPRGGKIQTCLWMIGASELFTADNMANDGFLDVLKLYSDKEDEDLAAAHTLYKGLTNKAKFQTLMVGEEYDMQVFELASLLINYLENPGDGTAYKNLIDELKLNKLDTLSPDLLSSDAKNTDTAPIIMAAEWTDIESLLDVMYEKAVLYGIHHLKNYQEADIFLKTLTDTEYPDSNNKDGIQNFVATKLYESLDKLCEAVNNWTPSGGSGSSGSLGSSGSSGGFGGSKKPSEKEIKVYEEETTVTVEKSAFSDVSAEHWANEAISYLCDKGIVNGTPDGLYQPERNISRAEFVKIICEAFKLSSKESASFSDVSENSWYARYCSVAGSLEIILGSDGAFRPKDKITRQDASVIIYRVLNHIGEAPEKGKAFFLDQTKISDYAIEAIQTLASAGLISGMGDNTFCPAENMTRAQCAQIVFNCLRR